MKGTSTSMKFWNQESDYDKLEPLTEQMIVRAEKELKVKLPQSYISLLKKQNGGYINFDAHPSPQPTEWADDLIRVDHIYGIAPNKGILQSSYLIKEWDLPKNLVLISGDGHWWIALDYRIQKEEPPVVYIESDGGRTIELARNFDSFLVGLCTWEYED